jgi:Bacterial Ig-like domain (group 1)/PKD domain
MLTGFMIARPNGRLAVLAAGALSLLVSACEKVPLLAPSGSTIILTASTNALPVGAAADIIAQVLEAAGTPPHSGTLVTFTTTLGTMEPAEARTDVGGRVIVKFLTGAANGSAVITATSGAATTGTNGALKIAVGTAAVGRVSVNANPAMVPANGGSTTIGASVFDINGNALRSAPVSFTTTAGTLSSSIVTTDANGIASTTLTTSQQATVTASVGAEAPAAPPPPTTPPTTPTTPTSSGQASGTVTVNVASAPTLVITPPSSPPSVGLPANFTFAVTAAAQNGSAVKELKVAWGDGESTSLGAVTGNAVASHVYDDDGTFTVTGTVTDVFGNSTSVSTSVTVIPVARPTVIVTPTPQSAPGGSTINFQIDIRAAAGVSIQKVTINFGDNTGTQSLGGFTGIVTVSHQYAAGVQTYTVIVTVTDSTGQTTSGSTTVSITT